MIININEESLKPFFQFLHIIQYFLWTSEFVQPICLPTPNIEPEIVAGLDTKVAGWGVTEEGKLTFNNDMKFLRLDIETLWRRTYSNHESF